MNPGELSKELYELFCGEYPSEFARRKAVYRYCIHQQGLTMALLKSREQDDPLRVRYARWLIGTLSLLAAMIVSLVIFLVRYSTYELDVIFASPSMRFGFLVMLLATVLFMAMALFSAFRARSVLNRAAYESLKCMASDSSSADCRS